MRRAKIGTIPPIVVPNFASAMGKVRSIKEGSIRAAATNDGIPTFWVSGVVGFDFTGFQLAEAVNMFGEVRLLLDTVGGDAADAFAFYDAVRVRGMKVHVEGYGRVASAGTVIMAAAGRNRSYLAPNCEYLIHEASGGDDVVVERYNERMARIYSEISGMSEKEARKIMKEDRFMSATEAKKLKLVGHILNHEAVAAQYKAMSEQVETPEVETPETTEAPETVTDVASTDTVTDAPEVEKVENAAEEVEIEQEIKVTVPEAIQAAMKGFITAKVKVASELSEAVANLTQEVKAKASELDEVKAEVESLAERLTAAEKAKEEAEAKASKLDEITAELETLRKAPVAEASDAIEGKEVQVPGGGPAGSERKLDRYEAKQKQRETEMREAYDRFKPKTNKA